MITINLLPEELRENISFSKKNRKMLKYLYALVFLSILLIASFVTCLVFLKITNDFSLKSIAENEKVISGYQDTLNKAKDLKSRLSSVEKIKNHYKYWSGLNYMLEKLTPSTIYLTNLAFVEDNSTLTKSAQTGNTENKDQKIEISGYAKDKKSVGLFRDMLENTSEVLKADIQSIEEVQVDTTKKNSFTMDIMLGKNAFSGGSNR